MNWLFLRGLFREKRHWGQFPQQFEKEISGSKVYLLDLPGFGEFASLSSPLSIQQVTDFVRVQWQSRFPQGEWKVLGHSLGGMVSLDWLARYPDDFNAGVVINTSCRTSAFWKRMSLLAFARLIQSATARDITKSELLGLRVISESNDINETLKDWVEIRKNSKMRFSQGARQVIAASRFHLPKNISKPVLVLASERDRMVSYNCGEQIAKTINARCLLNKKAGHDLALDDPQWIIKNVLEFSKN